MSKVCEPKIEGLIDSNKIYKLRCGNYIKLVRKIKAYGYEYLLLPDGYDKAEKHLQGTISFLNLIDSCSEVTDPCVLLKVLPAFQKTMEEEYEFYKAAYWELGDTIELHSNSLLPVFFEKIQGLIKDKVLLKIGPNFYIFFMIFLRETQSPCGLGGIGASIESGQSRRNRHTIFATHR